MLLALGPLTLLRTSFPLHSPERSLHLVAMGAHAKGEASCSAASPSQGAVADTHSRPSLSTSSPCSSALDAIREALQLLDSVRPEAQARDQLLDDKAQALLWLYICTLEAKMQEVSVAAVGLTRTGCRNYCPWAPNKLVSALFLFVFIFRDGVSLLPRLVLNSWAPTILPPQPAE